MAVSRDFRAQQQAKSEARLDATLAQIPEDIQAGTSYHQVGSLDGGPIRTRTVRTPVGGGELWDGGGNVFGPRSATVLLSQMTERGMSSPELVHPVELGKLGHGKLPEKRMEAPLVAARAGEVAVPVKGAASGELLMRGGSYDLLHVESQTSLRAVPKRLRDGRNEEERAAITQAVTTLVERSGVRLRTHGRERVEFHNTPKGPEVRVPSMDKFDSASRWATTVMRSVSTAIARSEGLSQHVQDAAVARGAVDSARRTRSRAIPAGSPEYQQVRSEALGAVATRAAKTIAEREGVYLAMDEYPPSGKNEAYYDRDKKTFYPRRPERAQLQPGQIDTRNQQFKEELLVGLAKAVGNREEKAAAKTGRALQVAEAAGVRVTGMNPKPDGLTPVEETARSSMVGDVAARATLERYGIKYEPGEAPEKLRAEQSEYARRPGALDQVWREAAGIRAHLASRDWQVERTPEQLEHSQASTYEVAERKQGKQQAASRGRAEETGPEQQQASGDAGAGAEQQQEGQGEKKSVLDRVTDLVR